MPFNKFNAGVVVFILSLIALPVLANEGAEGGGEAKSEGEGEAKSEGGSKKQHPDAVEWYKRTQKLAAIETKMKEETKNLQSLIESKNAGTKTLKGEKGAEQDILAVIVETHKKLLESYKKFEEEKVEVKYRYPGQGDLVERRYMSTRPPSLEQIERELGLDGNLTRLSKQIDTKYQKFVPARKVEPKRMDGPESTIKTVEQHAPQPLDEGGPKKLKLSR